MKKNDQIKKFLLNLLLNTISSDGFCFVFLKKIKYMKKVIYKEENIKE